MSGIILVIIIHRKLLVWLSFLTLEVAFLCQTIQQNKPAFVQYLTCFLSYLYYFIKFIFYFHVATVLSSLLLRFLCDSSILILRTQILVLHKRFSYFQTWEHIYYRGQCMQAYFHSMQIKFMCVFVMHLYYFHWAPYYYPNR